MLDYEKQFGISAYENTGEKRRTDIGEAAPEGAARAGQGGGTP
jgi:hypothetical protein